MDTSEQYIKHYIKMCDCPEIQELRNFDYKDGFESGDCFAWYDNNKLICSPVIKSWWYHIDSPCYVVMGGEARGIDTTEKVIWLPRQEDLQKMLGYDFEKLVKKFWKSFARFSEYEGASFFPPEWAHDDTFGVSQSKTWIKFNSMEQLWLALVMFELHGKVWAGEEWVKRES